MGIFASPMILIGNCITFVGAGFEVASCIVKERRQIFFLQAVECFLVAIASIFFNSYAGMTSMLLAGTRSMLIAHARYTKKWMIVFTVLVIALGLFANNRGWLGILPVIATVQYTICSYYLLGIKATKISIFVNLSIWIVYAFWVQDYSTAIFDCIALTVAGASITRMLYVERREKKEVALRRQG